MAPVVVATTKEKNDAGLDRPIPVKPLLATCSFIAGVVFVTAGITLWLISSLTSPSDDKYVVWLLILAFVLFGCGSHCLDLIEKEKYAVRK